MTDQQSPTPTSGAPSGAPVMDDVARLAASAAAAGRADFDEFFSKPNPVGRPAERIVGVHI